MLTTRYLFVALLAAHILSDFVLQTDSDVHKKNRLLPGTLFKHAFFVAALSYLFGGIWALWQLPILIAASHLLVDILKIKVEPGLHKLFTHTEGRDDRRPTWRLGVFLVDQALHVLIIIILVKQTYFLLKSFPPPCWLARFGETAPKVLILAAGIVLATNVGNILIGILVEPFLTALRGSPDQSLHESRGLTGGGKTIGKLERMLVLLFVLTAIPQGIGFLVAAKSIFRFGELKEARNRMEAEYIIIGTLYSFIWGIFIAEIVKRLLQSNTIFVI